MPKELLVHGVDVPVSAHEVSPIIWQALTSGTYEAKEARIARLLPKKGDRILELGTGLGLITTVLAQSASVRIWTFDANPHTIALARRIIDKNAVKGIEINHGLITAGEPSDYLFYIRKDFWMSSLTEFQGPYLSTAKLRSINIDTFLAEHNINVLVMDIEGAERQLLGGSRLKGVERVFLELHDHLYGLAGVRDIFSSMAENGFCFDPRKSSGHCVMFTRDDDEPRYYTGEEI